MRRTFVALAVCILVIGAPVPALAWGTAAHRFIMARAIDLLPAELKPFFEHYRAELVVRVVDPDTWRTAGWEEDHNHFVDFGMPELGPYPFTGLPRDYGAALEKFGMTTLKKIGMLPWREAEEFGNLRRAFEGFAKNLSYAPTDTVLFAAAASHYIQDAHQPLHASNNYDGQLTQQNGVHSRFETALFDRFGSKLTVTPGRVSGIRRRAMPPSMCCWPAISSSINCSGPTRTRLPARTVTTTSTSTGFSRGSGRSSSSGSADSVTATASLIVGAWEQAGKPALRIEIPRTVQKVRTPRAE